MDRAEAYAHECRKCGGVEIGPRLDDGIIEDELHNWACQDCGNERPFNRAEPYEYVDAWGVSWGRLLKMARIKDFDDFIDWARDQPSTPDEVD